MSAARVDLEAATAGMGLAQIDAKAKPDGHSNGFIIETEPTI
jgi:hypothetical protein